VFKLLGCIASQVNPDVKRNQRARRTAIGKAVSVPNGLAAHIGVYYHTIYEYTSGATLVCAIVYLLGPFGLQDLSGTHEFFPFGFVHLGCRPCSHFVRWMLTWVDHLQRFSIKRNVDCKRRDYVSR
jgi:hypothetical protein